MKAEGYRLENVFFTRALLIVSFLFFLALLFHVTQVVFADPVPSDGAETARFRHQFHHAGRQDAGKGAVIN